LLRSPCSTNVIPEETVDFFPGLFLFQKGGSPMTSKSATLTRRFLVHPGCLVIFPQLDVRGWSSKWRHVSGRANVYPLFSFGMQLVFLALIVQRRPPHKDLLRPSFSSSNNFVKPLFPLPLCDRFSPPVSPKLMEPIA